MADETDPMGIEPEPPRADVLPDIGTADVHALFGIAGQREGAPTLIVGSAGTADVSMEQPGSFIGRYRLIEALGEGGFGTVWRAEQHEPIHREVALKLIKPGMDSREIIARFEAERQALAMMDHPNIAAVLDAGTTQNGRPYFVMELVKGKPITEYADDRKLTIRQRLELFIPVCQAVQHAHQKAILHRDLKPSNILVAEVDGKPVPKVIDFGIAKAVGTSPEEVLRASLLQTQTGAFIGTPRYMSPEQAGAKRDLDTRSDIYTLGVILFELLTGDTPITMESLRSAAFDEMLRMIRESDPPRPSSRAIPATPINRTAATTRGTEPGRLMRMLRGDLDWISLKAIEKERERRYESAAALAADIERHLRNEPVEAGPPSAAYRLVKFARRNRLALGAAAIVFASLVSATGISLWQAARAARARSEAEANYAKARAAVDLFLTQVTENPKLKEADFFDLRKQLLETAIRFYEEFAQQETGDLMLRSEQADALMKLALVHQELGESALAEAAYRRAVELREKLVTESPAVDNYRMDLAKSLGDLANLLNDQGREAEALAMGHRMLELSLKAVSKSRGLPDNTRELFESLDNLGKLVLGDQGQAPEQLAAYRRVLMNLEKVATDFPAVPELRQKLADIHNDFGSLLSEHGQTAEAEATYRRALKIQEKLVAEFPGVRGYRRELAITHSLLGVLLNGQGQIAEAQLAFRRALDIREKLAAEFPSVPGYRQELSESHGGLGNFLKKEGKLAEAEVAYRRAIELQEKLAPEGPAVREYQSALGLTLHKLGMEMRLREQMAAARGLFERAIVLQRKALAGEPENTTYPQFLRMDYHMLSLTCLAMGDYAAASASAIETSKLYPTDWGEHILAASLLADCCVRVRDDPSLPVEQRTPTAEIYAKKAVELLRQAIATGFKDAAKLPNDEAFAALYTRPDFQALIPKEPSAR